MRADGRGGVRVRRRVSRRRTRLSMIVASIGALPALAACSGSIHPYHDQLADFFTASPTAQQAAPAPPVNSGSGAGQRAPSASEVAATGSPASAAVSTSTNIATVASASAPAPQPSAQQGTVATASAASPPSAAPSDGVHPSESLFDLFKSHPARSAEVSSAPHPPGTYTPASDSGAGATAAASPPAADSGSAPAAMMPYPQQSLGDIFGKKSDAQ